MTVVRHWWSQKSGFHIFYLSAFVGWVLYCISQDRTIGGYDAMARVIGNIIILIGIVLCSLVRCSLWYQYEREQFRLDKTVRLCFYAECFSLGVILLMLLYGYCSSVV